MKAYPALIALFVTTLVIAMPVQAQQSPPQQSSSQRSVSFITNKDILDMQQAGLGADVIIAKIESSPCNFDTSPAALEALRVAHIPNEVRSEERRVGKECRSRW